jgi:hypothetical protein
MEIKRKQVKKELYKATVTILFFLCLPTALLSQEDKASLLLPDTDSILVMPLLDVSWQELIPFQPPEKWLSPKGEDDEWYKRRQQQKYRKRQ